MLNTHHRRIFTVAPAGQQSADFTQLSTAISEVIAASAANGTWSATNRALIVVYGRINEFTTILLTTTANFIDVHFAAGGSLAYSIDASTTVSFGAGMDTDGAGMTHQIRTLSCNRITPWLTI